MNERNAKIIKDAEEQNIPIFVFVAKDSLSTQVLNFYANLAEDSDCDEQFVADVDTELDKFTTWQEVNPDKVKLPD